jgi:hypothetical protein
MSLPPHLFSSPFNMPHIASGSSITTSSQARATQAAHCGTPSQLSSLKPTSSMDPGTGSGQPGNTSGWAPATASLSLLPSKQLPASWAKLFWYGKWGGASPRCIVLIPTQWPHLENPDPPLYACNGPTKLGKDPWTGLIASTQRAESSVRVSFSGTQRQKPIGQHHQLKPTSSKEPQYQASTNPTSL